MKAPRCPKCGKEHYSTQRCSAEAVCGPRVKSPSTSAAPAGSGLKDSRDRSNVGSVGSRGNVESPDAPTPTTPPAPPAGISTSSGSTTNSDRPTDKAKARERVDDTAGDESPAPPPSKASRGGKRVVEPAALTDEQWVAVKEKAVAMYNEDKARLTAAEKQKAYRERHKDRVQEADRLRKKAKRNV